MTEPNRPLRGCLTVVVAGIFGFMAILSVFVGNPNQRFENLYLFWFFLIIGGIWTLFPAMRGGNDSSNQMDSGNSSDSDMRNGENSVLDEPHQPMAPAKIQGHFPPDQLHLMLEHSISFDGRQFTYGNYRYDRLEDAVAYAELQARKQNR